jgi:hypothetical protein
MALRDMITVKDCESMRVIRSRSRDIIAASRDQIVERFDLCVE